MRRLSIKKTSIGNCSFHFFGLKLKENDEGERKTDFVWFSFLFLVGHCIVDVCECVNDYIWPSKNELAVLALVEMSNQPIAPASFQRYSVGCHCRYTDTHAHTHILSHMLRSTEGRNVNVLRAFSN